MNKTHRYLLLCVGIIQLVFTSCKKQDQVGPNIEGIYGPLTIVTTLNKSADNIQFATGQKVYFTAGFESDAVWKLTIKGQTSKAVKTFEGISKSLNATNSTWDGSADSAPSFRAEVCDVILTFPNSIKDTLKTTITITSKKAASPKEVIITDF